MASLFEMAFCVHHPVAGNLFANHLDARVAARFTYNLWMLFPVWEGLRCLGGTEIFEPGIEDVSFLLLRRAVFCREFVSSCGVFRRMCCLVVACYFTISAIWMIFLSDWVYSMSKEGRLDRHASRYLLLRLMAFDLYWSLQ